MNHRKENAAGRSLFISLEIHINGENFAVSQKRFYEYGHYYRRASLLHSIIAYYAIKSKYFEAPKTWMVWPAE